MGGAYLGQGLLRITGLFLLSPDLNSPTIPAKAGIQINASWIPAFAGMVGSEMDPMVPGSGPGQASLSSDLIRGRVCSGVRAVQYERLMI